MQLANAELIKSPLDTREYRYIELDNGMKVLLVSDVATKKSAVTVNVAVGNGSDPKGREGLAHFLEHMLFLGTSKYPQAGEYQRFIRAHGGHHNAWTALEHTVYYFDVAADFFEPALDRFARFFSEPLFDASLVERERNIVHSEYTLRRGNEGRRMWTAMRVAYNPAHPLSRFAAGNKNTLADRENARIRDELIDFFNTYYAANVMTVALLAPEPLEVLEGWARKYFSAIPNREVPAMMAGQPLFEANTLPALLYARPHEQRRRLELVFPVPALRDMYRTKPLHLAASLIGHEGDGSLLSRLKIKNWATALHAGTGINLEAHATFGVNITLTEQGLAHWQQVASEVFRHINLVREHGLQSWRYEEERQLSHIDFAYAEKARSLAHVIALSGALHRYPTAHILNGPFLLETFDAEEQRRYVQHLHAQNVLVVVEGADVPVTDKTKQYEVEYSLQSLAPDWLGSAAQPDVAQRSDEEDGQPRLPVRNRFIPKDLKLKKEASDVATPQLVMNKNGLKLWHHNDISYQTPRANFYFSVRSKRASASAANSVLTDMYIRAASEALNEFTYPASVAGLAYGMYRNVRGYTVRISGYNEKQKLLLQRILKVLAKPTLSEQRFKLYLKELVQQLQNQRYDDLYTQLYDDVPQLLVQPYWSTKERISAAEGLTYSEYQNFARGVHNDINIIALAHGNVTSNEARRFGRLLRRHLLRDAQVTTVPRARVALLPQSKRHYYHHQNVAGDSDDSVNRKTSREQNTDEKQKAVLVYMQGRNRTPVTRAHFALLAELLAPSFYNEFRVQRDLGYIVHVANTPLVDVPGLSFVMQSSVYTPAVMERYVEEFLSETATTIKSMSQSEFESFKHGLISKLQERHLTLNGSSGVYWRDIAGDYAHFHNEARIISELNTVTRAQLAGVLDALVTGQHANRLVIAAGGDDEKTQSSSHPPGPVVLLKDVHALQTAVARFL